MLHEQATPTASGRTISQETHAMKFMDKIGAKVAQGVEKRLYEVTRPLLDPRERILAWFQAAPLGETQAKLDNALGIIRPESKAQAYRGAWVLTDRRIFEWMMPPTGGKPIVGSSEVVEFETVESVTRLPKDRNAGLTKTGVGVVSLVNGTGLVFEIPSYGRDAFDHFCTQFTELN